MKSIIVGTAGHIDHGKTALVKALTGIDADRWEEEKRRGITIDIGFAHLELPTPTGETLRLGFVDVPGHERFVRNMLAGIGGIDLVLLVIGADESVMPQTREHFDICRLLSIRRGITVLNKCDLVDPETLDVVRMEVEEFVRGSFLDASRSPIIAVSSKTGEGLDKLKEAMVAIAAEIPPKSSSAAFRLPIDRVFTMKGFGTVVTGTLLSGVVRKEQELEVFPTGKRVRVRGVQVHGAMAEQAQAGQRTALNLAGIAIEDLARGMALAPVDTFRPTKRLDASVVLLPGARPLRDRARVHLHAHTAETIAEVVLHRPPETSPSATNEDTAVATRRSPELGPGQSTWAQLRLAEPLLLLPGDRFILRQFSPVVTIGGGVVLDPFPLPKKAQTVEIGTYLDTLAHGSPEEVLKARVERRGKSGIAFSDAVAETGWLRAQVESAATTLLGNRQILRIADVLVSSTAFQSAKNEAVAAVTAFHNANPLVAAISKEELREKLDLGPEVFSAMLDFLVREKKLETTGEQVRIPGRGVVMKDDEAESKKQIEMAFARAGLKVPALKEVLAGVRVDKVRAQKIVTLLLRDKVLVKLSDELVFHRSALEQLRRMITAYKTKSPKIDVAKFKDLTGVSRKYAIPLLEYLDRERLTRRVGDERVIL